MNELRELYQEVIFDHYRKPRNFGQLAHANREAEGYNPLCGDKIKLYLQVENGIIKDASFMGTGCAISTASASLMTENLKGKREEDALRLFKNFRSMLTDETDAAADTAAQEKLGKLQALAGVREFPQRVKCATLAWHTLQAALADKHETVTTEC